jgi:hypothetical protein
MNPLFSSVARSAQYFPYATQSTASPVPLRAELIMIKVEMKAVE